MSRGPAGRATEATDRLRLVVVTPRFPFPLEKGDKLRAYHQIRTLADRHDVVLVALADAPVDAADRARLEPFCRRIEVLERPRARIAGSGARSLLAGRPLQVGYFDDAPSALALAAIVAEERPDVVYAQLVRSLPVVDGLDVPVVMDLQDAFSAITRRRADAAPLPLRPALRAEARRITRYEARALRRVDRAVIISEADRQLLGGDAADVVVVPNGVDVGHFAPPATRPAPTHDIAFVGNLGYRPNVEAAHFLCEQVLPELRRRRPGARLLLAGARPARSVRALAGDGVEVTGWLDDIRDAYLAAPVLVAPLFGGAGQQNKILEAMAMGTPCVTSERVNAAIGARDGTEVLVAADAAGFAAAADGLLADPDRAAAQADAARGLVQRRYTWPAVVDVLDEVLAAAAAGRRAGADRP